MPESEVKIFKISGSYVKKHQKFNFTKYARALTEENAMEKVYTIVTASNILRRKIKITECKTVKTEECDDIYIRSLAEL